MLYQKGITSKKAGDKSYRRRSIRRGRDRASGQGRETDENKRLPGGPLKRPFHRRERDIRVLPTIRVTWRVG